MKLNTLSTKFFHLLVLICRNPFYNTEKKEMDRERESQTEREREQKRQVMCTGIYSDVRLFSST